MKNKSATPNRKLKPSGTNLPYETSSCLSRINNIREYFRTLPQWDQRTDYIQQLADTIDMGSNVTWYEFLRSWLIRTINNAMTDIGCQNHVCLVLTGKKGQLKSTWLNNLCPKSLTRYLFTGKIDPTNKDTLICIAEFLFININDQLQYLNKKDGYKLKDLITTPSVRYRPYYERYIIDCPHIASFMASMNIENFRDLSFSPSGNFLFYKVEQIDIEAAQNINLDQVYSQAYYLLKSE